MFFFLFIFMFPVTDMYNKDPCEDDLFIYKGVIALFTNVFILLLLSLLCTLLTLSSFILSLVMKTHNELRLIFIRPAR